MNFIAVGFDSPPNFHRDLPARRCIGILRRARKALSGGGDSTIPMSSLSGISLPMWKRGPDPGQTLGKYLSADTDFERYFSYVNFK